MRRVARPAPVRTPPGRPSSVTKLPPVRRVALFHRPECGDAARTLGSDLRASGFSVVTRRDAFRSSKADLIVLLGGDGFLMETVRALDYPETPVFGVNFGTVGFLMNSRTCLDHLVRAVRLRRFLLHDHPVLEARARDVHGRESVNLALNDIVLERQAGQSVRLRLSINDVLFNEFSGDGVIIATPAGSTAYNLAAGGPVVHPGVPSMVLTPLYPHRAEPFHSLEFSVVVPLVDRLEVAGIETAKRPIRLLADGRILVGIDRVRVSDSGKRIRLLHLETHEFIATLSRKFIGE